MLCVHGYAPLRLGRGKAPDRAVEPISLHVEFSIGALMSHVFARSRLSKSHRWWLVEYDLPLWTTGAATPRIDV